MFGLPKIDSDYTVWLQLDGKEYELNKFNIGFGQSVDHKGQPQDEVRGGLLRGTFLETVPHNVYLWAMKNTAKEGSVVFKVKSGSSPFKVDFMNAFCIGFKQQIDSVGGGVTSTISISPEELRINEISFDNHW